MLAYIRKMAFVALSLAVVFICSVAKSETSLVANVPFETARKGKAYQQSAMHRLLPYNQPFSKRDSLDTKISSSVVEGKIDSQRPSAHIEEVRHALRLVGTAIVESDILISQAVIKDIETNKQAIYKLDDLVRGARIRKIERELVVLELGKEYILLSMNETTSSDALDESETKESDNTIRSLKEEVRAERITLSSSDVAASLNNNRILTEAKANPFFQNKKLSGFFLSNIRKGSLFEKMGLKNSDIVQSLEGRQIKSLDDVFMAYETFTKNSSLDMGILRDGETIYIEYRIE
jgi:type II secretion system protein C